MGKRRILFFSILFLSATEGGWQSPLPFSLVHLLLPLGIVLSSPGESLVFILFSSFWEVFSGRGFLGVGIALAVVGVILRSILRIYFNVSSPALIPPLIFGVEILRLGMSGLFSSLYHVHGPPFLWQHVIGEVGVGTILLLTLIVLWQRSVPRVYR
jgi:hypothetical protein